MWSFCNEAACELSVKDPNGTSPQVRSIETDPLPRFLMEHDHLKGTRPKMSTPFEDKALPVFAFAQLGAPLFAAAVKAEDGTRPTAANTPGWHGNYPPWIASDELTENIDIQGFSHTGSGGNDAAVAFHAMPQYLLRGIFKFVETNPL